MRKKFALLLAAGIMCCVGTISVASVADEVAVAGKSSVSELIDDLDSSAYGGIFYDEDGVLHIFAKDREALLKSRRLQNVVRNREMEIVIEEAEYSLDELESAQKRLLEHQNELAIVAVGLYEPENALSVYTSDTSDENKAAIASVAGVKNIRYKESSGFAASPANGDFEKMSEDLPENSNIVGRTDASGKDIETVKNIWRRIYTDIFFCLKYLYYILLY